MHEGERACTSMCAEPLFIGSALVRGPRRGYGWLPGFRRSEMAAVGSESVTPPFPELRTKYMQSGIKVTVTAKAHFAYYTKMMCRLLLASLLARAAAQTCGREFPSVLSRTKPKPLPPSQTYTSYPGQLNWGVGHCIRQGTWGSTTDWTNDVSAADCKRIATPTHPASGTKLALRMRSG